MPTNLAEVKINRPDTLKPVPQPPTASTTDIDVSDEVRQTIAAVSYAALIEDLMIAVKVRERDATDTGERVALEDAIWRFGFKLEDFGLE